MSVQALPYISILAIFFGTTLIASRFSVGQYEPLTYIGLRLTLAALFYVVIYTLSSKRAWPRDRRIWKHAPVLGVFSTAIPMTFIVSSLQYQSSGVTSLLLTAGPALTVVMAHFWLSDEHLTWRKSIGVGLAIGGAALLVLSGENGLPDVEETSPIGYILVLSAMLLASGMTIYARKYMQDLDSLDVSSVRMGTAALFMLPISLLLVGFDLSAVTATGYAALLWASIFGTFLGMLLAFYNIKRFGATASAMTSNLIPIVAGVGGVLLLDEQITPVMLGGMGLILAGVAILNQRQSSIAGAEPQAVKAVNRSDTVV